MMFLVVAAGRTQFGQNKGGIEKNKEMKSSLFGDFREKKTKKKKIVGVVVVVCEIGGIVWEKKAKNSVKKNKNKGL
jgi:hypothetical protein